MNSMDLERVKVANWLDLAQYNGLYKNYRVGVNFTWDILGWESALSRVGLESGRWLILLIWSRLEHNFHLAEFWILIFIYVSYVNIRSRHMYGILTR